MNAQISTQEQLEWLQAFYNGLNAKPTTVDGLIRLANVNGLYDAADHVYRKAFPDGVPCAKTLTPDLMVW